MRVTTWPAALLCGMALALPVAAQEDAVPDEPQPPPTETKAEAPPPAPPKKGAEDPPLHRWGGWTISAAAWEPALVGADEEVATSLQDGVPVPLMQSSETDLRETIAVAFHLPRDLGSIAAHYDAIIHDDTLVQFTPGQFNYFETRAYPLLLGVFDDGTADGVRATSIRRTREFRLEYQKRAFDSRWARGTWGVGFRQLSHGRGLGISYYAIVANLPPVIPPAGTIDDILRLLPRPDFVTQSSDFSGNGLGATLDVEFPLHPRVSIISGLSVGLIRGRASSYFTSISSYYFLNGSPDVPLSKDELFAILSNPADPNDPNGIHISDVDQASLLVALKTSSSSQFAQSYDLYAGVEVRVYRGLKVFATVREVYFVNVGEKVVPTTGFANDRTSLNAGYDGYTVGLSWRF